MLRLPARHLLSARPSFLRPSQQAYSSGSRAAARAAKRRLMADTAEARQTFNIAVEGCCHGELDTIYSTLQYLEQKEGKKIDLLICCGDFQAVRNLDDMECMAVPDKYKQIMTFYKYYSGEKQAPYPTVFIGGNHEAMNYLWELHYGGWAAPNIFFLGYSGVVQFGGHRIAGLSGTYSEAHYDWGHFEAPPYSGGTLRSAYHVRRLHTHRLMQLRDHVDIFLTHDWPLLITQYGNRDRLFAKKPYFKAEALRDELGSQAAQDLLAELQPSYWFSAHLHVKFPAIVPHTATRMGRPPQQQQQQQQQDAAAGAGGGAAAGEKATKFLALDKCLPRREFLQVLELPVRGPLQLQYDPEWLAILRSTHGFMSLQKYAPPLPRDWGGRAGPRAEDVAYVHEVLEKRGGAEIPSNFASTAPAYSPASGKSRGSIPRSIPRNPQTTALLDMLGLEYNLDAAGQQQAQQYQPHQQQQQRTKPPPPAAAGAASAAASRAPIVAVISNPEEIALSDDGDDGVWSGEEGEQRRQAAAAEAMQRASEVLLKAKAAAADDAEIALDEDE